MSKLIYKYKQLNQRISYEESLKIIKKKHIVNYHLGQLKLFMCELLFLSKFIDLSGIHVLYVGAACGYHTHYMARLFSHWVFELYDKQPFDKIFYTKPLPNVKIHKEYFTNEKAIQYKNSNKKILFMCDMRDLEISNVADNIELLDNLIVEDMQMQMSWAKTMLPIATYLKFRLPYKLKSITYFKGSIYLQPYYKAGTETRLLIRNYEKTQKYDCVANDETMAYFNCCVKTQEQNTKWKQILESNNIVNNWDNNYSMFICNYYLKKKNKSLPDIQTVFDLFIDVVKFHQKLNDKKYDIIFN